MHCDGTAVNQTSQCTLVIYSRSATAPLSFFQSALLGTEPAHDDTVVMIGFPAF
jgi:hypothetical protein